MPKILVTGGAGFIGSALIQALVAQGDSVVSVDNFNNYYDPKLKRDRIEKFLSGVNFKMNEIDICDFAALDKIFSSKKFDAICHLAAQAGVRYSLENPFAYEKANILGTLNLLELAKKHQVRNFIFASSSSVYGGNTKVPFSETDRVDNPVSLYAVTKKADELMAHTYHHLYGMNCTGLRFFTVYGPWGRPDMALFIFTKAIFEGRPIDVFNNGKMERDFTYIDDIIDGIIRAIDRNSGYEIYNLGNNKPIALEYFIQVIEKNIGAKTQKNLLPMQEGDVPKTWADIEKAKTKLGWEPKTGIEEGIEKFLQWYKEYYKISN